MNQNPEQQARDRIDEQLTACGWTIQNKSSINLHAAIGIAVREYQTGIGPADYVLFVEKKPVGLIEAKRKEEGVHLTVHEEQSQAYAESRLKYLNNDPLAFVYESTGEVTRFTDYRDPKPRSRNIFTFHRPETFREWLKEEKTLRGRLHDLPHLTTTGLRDCQTTAITNLERSFKAARPKALIQMATGSGKTFTAISFIYRLLKFAKAKRGKYKDEDKKITAFRITQKIVDDYRSGKYNREWNWYSIVDRWNWFCEEVEQLFNLDLSDRRYTYDDIVVKNNTPNS